MELKLFSTDNAAVDNYNWDIDVVDGLPVLLDEESEIDQIATVAAYLGKGTVPLMEEKGNDWAGYLLSEKTLTQLDSEVRGNINTYTDQADHVPMYYVEDEQLKVTIGRVNINTGAM